MDTLGFTDAELITAVGSIFVPLLIAFIMRQTWSDTLRVVVSYLFYAAYTFVSLWFLNEIVFDENTTAKMVVRTFFMVAVVAYLSFKAVWQPRGITSRLEARTNA